MYFISDFKIYYFCLWLTNKILSHGKYVFLQILFLDKWVFFGLGRNFSILLEQKFIVFFSFNVSIVQDHI